MNDDSLKLFGKYIGEYEILGIMAKGGQGVVYLAFRESPHDPKISSKAQELIGEARKLNQGLPRILKKSQEDRTATERDALEHARGWLGHRLYGDPPETSDDLRKALSDCRSFYAVKVPRERKDGNDEKAIHDEAGATGVGVVQMDRFGRYLITNFMPSSLGRHFSQRQPWGKVVDIMVDLLKSVENLHRREQRPRILHMDLKPDNVLLDGNDKPLLTDFGCSQRTNDAVYSDARSEVFTAPEVYKGKYYDERSDIFSLGQIFCAGLLGKLQVPGDRTIRELADGETSGSLLLVTERGDPVPSDILERLIEIVSIAQAVEPADRYQSVSEMRRDLEAFRARFLLETKLADPANAPPRKVDRGPEPPVDGKPAESQVAPEENQRNEDENQNEPPRPKRWPVLATGVLGLAGIAFSIWYFFLSGYDVSPSGASFELYMIHGDSLVSSESGELPKRFGLPNEFAVLEIRKPGYGTERRFVKKGIPLPRLELSAAKELTVIVTETNVSGARVPTPNATVRITPRDAEISVPENLTIDFLGETGLPGDYPDLRPGWHTVQVTAHAMQPWHEDVNVSTTDTLYCHLVPADLTVEVFPRDSRVVVDGTRAIYDGVPFAVRADTRVQVSRPGFAKFDSMLVWDSRGAHRVIILEPVEAPYLRMLTIDSEPSGATILLDGDSVGVTPETLTSFDSRDRQLELRHGCLHWEPRLIDIPRGGALLDPVLRRFPEREYIVDALSRRQVQGGGSGVPLRIIPDPGEILEAVPTSNSAWKLRLPCGNVDLTVYSDDSDLWTKVTRTIDPYDPATKIYLGVTFDPNRNPDTNPGDDTTAGAGINQPVPPTPEPTVMLLIRTDGTFQGYDVLVDDEHRTTLRRNRVYAEADVELVSGKSHMITVRGSSRISTNPITITENDTLLLTQQDYQWLDR